MTKVIGPLFSLDARGTLGDTLIYSKQSGTNYTKTYAVPSNPKTDDQMGIRIGTSAITKAWSLLTDEQKAAWEPLADELRLSAYHAFLTFNSRRWAKHFMPSVVPEPTGTFILEYPDVYESHVGRLYTTSITANIETGTPFMLEFTWATSEKSHRRKHCRVLSTDFELTGDEFSAEESWLAPNDTLYYTDVRIINTTGATTSWLVEEA